MGSASSSADVFRAIADETRRGLLDRLAGNEKPATDLGRRFSMSQPAVSQHLRELALRPGAWLVIARNMIRDALVKEASSLDIESVYGKGKASLSPNRLNEGSPTGHFPNLFL